MRRGSKAQQVRGEQVQATGDSKRRILFVGAFPTNPKAGVHGGQLTLCRAIASSAAWTAFNFIPFDSTQRSIPAPPLPVRAVLAVSRLVRFTWILRRRRITDVIVMTANGGSAIEKTIMLAIARGGRRRTAFYPVAYQLFEDVERSKFWRAWVTLSIRLSTLIICQGEIIAAAAKRLGGTPTQCRVVPNMADLSDLYGSLDENERSNTIVFLGWLNASKGIFDLLTAIDRSDELRTVPMVICGDGADISAARAMAAKLGLSRVEFLGWVETNRVREILKSACTVVLPSYTEGMPGCIIEGLAAGAVVVTTPVGVITDYIVDGETGLIVPIGNPRRLALALERVQRDPALRLRLRTNGQRLAREAFDKDRAYGHLMAALFHMAREDLRHASGPT